MVKLAAGEAKVFPRFLGLANTRSQWPIVTQPTELGKLGIYIEMTCEQSVD